MQAKRKREGETGAEEKVIAVKKYRLPSRVNFGRITNCQNEGGGNKKLPHHCGLHKRRSIRRRLSGRGLRHAGPTQHEFPACFKFPNIKEPVVK